MRRAVARLRSREGNGQILAKLTKFLVVGGSGVIVNTVALYIFYQVSKMPLLLASTFAVELAIINNFLWNNSWTFGQQDISIGRFLRFNLISIGGLAITTATLSIVTSFGVYYLLANLVGITLATIWNFALNMMWTWRWQ